MFLIGLILLFAAPLSAVDYYDEGKRFAEELQKRKATQDEKTYLKKKVEESKADEGKRADYYDQGKRFAETQQKKEKCTLTANLTADPNTSLYVFISFSVPDETWIMLSNELEKTDGIFVLRGLPENSFRELAVKMQDLRKKGIMATVQIDPLLFEKYGIEQVPCFVIAEEKRFDKLSGNVTLAYALEKMEAHGETAIAKTMRAKL